MDLQLLLDYGLRVAPGAVLIAIAFVLTPRAALAVRAGLLILLFILIRDAMVAVGIWRVEVTPGGWAVWMRFLPDAGVLLVLAGTAAATVVAILLADRQLAARVRWGDPRSVRGWLLGLAGIAVIVAPFALLHLAVPVELRGGAVPLAVLPALLALALVGNLLEELLFRGFAQGLIAERHGETRALLLSALLFSAGHVFLASTVTSVGWPVLAFTLYEGLILAWIARRAGVLPAALAHGGAIFLLASGLV